MERLGSRGFVVVVFSLTVALSDSVFSVSGSGADDRPSYSNDVVNAARCRVRCLTILQVF